MCIIIYQYNYIENLIYYLRIKICFQLYYEDFLTVMK